MMHWEHRGDSYFSTLPSRKNSVTLEKSKTPQHSFFSCLQKQSINTNWLKRPAGRYWGGTPTNRLLTPTSSQIAVFHTSHLQLPFFFPSQGLCTGWRSTREKEKSWYVPLGAARQRSEWTQYSWRRCERYQRRQNERGDAGDGLTTKFRTAKGLVCSLQALEAFCCARHDVKCRPV